MLALPYLVLLLVILVVATGLLAFIARLLYTLREQKPEVAVQSPVRIAASGPSALPVSEMHSHPVAAQTVSQRESAAEPQAAPSSVRQHPSSDISVPAPQEPVFYEYTDGGLVPVDPNAPTSHPAAEDTAGGDSDLRVAAEEIEPEEEGFVWL